MQIVSTRRFVFALLVAALVAWGCDRSSPAPAQPAQRTEERIDTSSADGIPREVELDESEVEVIRNAQACDTGDAAACYRVGMAFYEGRGIDQDRAKARELFEQACAAGEKEACDAARLKSERR